MTKKFWCAFMPHSVEMIGNSTTISVVSANSNHNECLLKIM